MSCTSPSFCMAVGYYEQCPSCADLPMAEKWDGRSWSLAMPPAPPPCRHFCAASGQLSGVACLTGTSCVAVGFRASDAGASPLADTWNGTRWSQAPVPDPPGGRATGFGAVSCPQVLPCTAAGDYLDVAAGESRPLAESWNGTAWTAQTTPPAAPGALDTTLTGVSCTSPASCTAVGQFLTPAAVPDPAAGYYGTYNSHTLALGWDGSSWTTQHPVDPPGAPVTSLSAVACAGPPGAAPACAAVGGYGYGNGTGEEPGFSLIERHPSGP